MSNKLDWWTELKKLQAQGDPEELLVDAMWAERLAAAEAERPRLWCCGDAAQYIGAAMHVGEEQVEGRWVMSPVTTTWDRTVDGCRPITFCPFCGGRLPPLEFRPHPSSHYRRRDHDGQCLECGEPSDRTCPCLPTICAWKVGSAAAAPAPASLATLRPGGESSRITVQPDGSDENGPDRAVKRPSESEESSRKTSPKLDPPLFTVAETGVVMWALKEFQDSRGGWSFFTTEKGTANLGRIRAKLEGQ